MFGTDDKDSQKGTKGFIFDRQDDTTLGIKGSIESGPVVKKRATQTGAQLITTPILALPLLPHPHTCSNSDRSEVFS